MKRSLVQTVGPSGGLDDPGIECFVFHFVLFFTVIGKLPCFIRLVDVKEYLPDVTDRDLRW